MRVQAKDIPDKDIMVVVQRVMTGIGASRWNIAEAMNEFPFMVVNAKLKALKRRGLLNGCTAHSDCRGDFTITEKGAAFLAVTPSVPAA